MYILINPPLHILLLAIPITLHIPLRPNLPIRVPKLLNRIVDNINDILPPHHEIHIAVDFRRLNSKMTRGMVRNLALVLAHHLRRPIRAGIPPDILDNLATVLDLRRCSTRLVHKRRVAARTLTGGGYRRGKTPTSPSWLYPTTERRARDRTQGAARCLPL